MSIPKQSKVAEGATRCSRTQHTVLQTHKLRATGFTDGKNKLKIATRHTKGKSWFTKCPRSNSAALVNTGTSYKNERPRSQTD